MEKTSCKLPLICIRRHPNETSELISQMLYGESCTVLETEKDYARISMDFDATEGWVVSSSLKKEGNSVRSVIQTPFSFVQTKEGRYLLSMGAEIGAGSPVPPLPATPESVVETAKSFLNAPYLYGGRSFLGLMPLRLLNWYIKYTELPFRGLQRGSQSVERLSISLKNVLAVKLLSLKTRMAILFTRE